MYQSNFRFRRWIEGEKKAIPDRVQEFIDGIETHLLPLKGEVASVVNHLKELEKVEKVLLEFYSGSGNQYSRHLYDMEHARLVEFQFIADQLFSIMGGTSGCQRDPSKSCTDCCGPRSASHLVWAFFPAFALPRILPSEGKLCLTDSINEWTLPILFYMRMANI